MSMITDLLLGPAAAALAVVLAVVLLRRSRAERDAATGGIGRELAANALGFLLVGSVVASSGLLADALCRLVQSQG